MLRMYVKGWTRREKDNITASFDRGQLLELLTVSSDIILELKLCGSLGLTESGVWGPAFSLALGSVALLLPDSQKGAHETVLWSS